MGWIGWVHCEKSRQDFVARTFALIAPVHPILHRVSCSYEMIPNAPKHYDTHRNMSLGSNRVDQVCLLGKIKTWLRGTNFCINCTSSVCFAPSFMQLRIDPKCTQILWSIPKHYFSVQLGGLGLSIAKKSRHHFVARIFALIAPVHRILHRVSCSYETIPNAPKYYKGPMGWIGCVRCKKSRRHFVARTLALIAPIHPILHRVSCSYNVTSWHEVLH